MKPILIPTDFSQNSKNAMRYAVKFFEDTPCHFFMLYANIDGSHFSEKPVYDFGTNIVVEKVPKAIDRKIRLLKEFFVKLPSKKDHHQLTILREDDHFIASIRKYVQEKKVELIVMGTRGASEIKEFFLGSHAGDVITKVECDVLVVPDKARYRGFKSVVLPVDFELDYSDEIIGTLATLIGKSKAEIRLLYVTKTQINLFEAVETEKERLIRRLSGTVKNPISFHRTVSKKIDDGVRDFADKVKADLIVMVSKDYGRLQQLFLDTTVEEVSFKTKIPLLSLQG